MQQRISGEFATRRDAELAVERIVQEHGIDRRAVEVKPRGSANSAGTKVAGADAESGHPGVGTHGDPELNGAIDVSIACTGTDRSAIEAALKEAGATTIKAR
jgi:hypothetical protein